MNSVSDKIKGKMHVVEGEMLGTAGQTEQEEEKKKKKKKKKRNQFHFIGYFLSR
jgi:hypothetical protein